jgi:hypothetical protein
MGSLVSIKWVYYSKMLPECDSGYCAGRYLQNPVPLIYGTGVSVTHSAATFGYTLYSHLIKIPVRCFSHWQVSFISHGSTTLVVLGIWGSSITLRHTELGRTPPDEWSARLRDDYLTKQNTDKRQTSIPPAAFEPAIAASEWPHPHALDHAAAGNRRTLVRCFTSFHVAKLT